MEKGSYKRLLVKLSGAGLGLAAMLGVTTMMLQNHHVDKVSSAEPSIYSKSLSPHMIKEFDIITETGGLDTQLSLACVSSQPIKAELFERLIEIKLSAVETINDTIKEISYEAMIPSTIKENILFNLELQLEKAEKSLQEIENQSAIFFYNNNPSLMNLSNNSACDKDDIIVIEKCEGQCATSDSELDEKSSNRNTTEAFFWI